nr:hypothetical protein [Actinomyces gerencseriae]
MMWRDGEVLALRRDWGPAGRRCAELDARVVVAPACLLYTSDAADD